MKRPLLIAIASLFIIGIVAMGGAALRPGAALARPSAQSAASPTREYWKSGITVDETLDYEKIIGRLMTESALFSPARSADSYYVFSPSAKAKTIEAARFYLLESLEDPTNEAILTLEIIDFDGFLQHRVTARAVDLRETQTGAWGAFSLWSAPDNLTVEPGEFLAIHYHASTAADDAFRVRALFEVQVVDAE